MPKRKDILELSKQSVKRRCNQQQNGEDSKQRIEARTECANIQPINQVLNELEDNINCEEENSSARLDENNILEEYFSNEFFPLSSMSKLFFETLT